MRLHPSRPAALALALLAGACGGRGKRASSAADVTPLRTMRADSVFILGATGDAPVDTVVQLQPGQKRVVVLRHPPPDLTTFAVVEFGDSAFGADAGEVTFHSRPETYAVDITSTRPIRDARITFKYARHFKAPAAARERYGTDAAFERRLAVGHLKEGGMIDLLPTSRPVADNVSAKLDGPGSYVVASPKAVAAKK